MSAASAGAPKRPRLDLTSSAAAHSDAQSCQLAEALEQVSAAGLDALAALDALDDDADADAALHEWIQATCKELRSEVKPYGQSKKAKAARVLEDLDGAVRMMTRLRAAIASIRAHLETGAPLRFGTRTIPTAWPAGNPSIEPRSRLNDDLARLPQNALRGLVALADGDDDEDGADAALVGWFHHAFSAIKTPGTAPQYVDYILMAGALRRAVRLLNAESW